MFVIKITIFAENFNVMQLLKDQINLLKSCLSVWAGMVVAMVSFVIFGKHTRNETLWLLFGVTMAEIVVVVFLMFGSRVPKVEKGETKWREATQHKWMRRGRVY